MSNTGRKRIYDVALAALGQPPIPDPTSPHGYIEEQLASQFDTALESAIRDCLPHGALFGQVLERMDLEFPSHRLPYAFALPAGYVTLEAIAPQCGHKVMQYEAANGARRSVLRANSPGPLSVDFYSSGAPELLDGHTVHAAGLMLAILAGRSKVSAAEIERLEKRYTQVSARARGSGALEEFQDDDVIGSPAMDAFYSAGGQ